MIRVDAGILNRDTVGPRLKIVFYRSCISPRKTHNDNNKVTVFILAIAFGCYIGMK